MSTKETNLSFFKKEEVPNAKGLRFSIVVSKWNESITNGLYEGAIKTLIDAGVNLKDIKTHDVPGSFELIFGTKIAAKDNSNAIICIGSIIEGETKHFDFVCNAVSIGIKDLNISLPMPVIFGVLTDNNMQQAVDRSGGKYGNKGIEAAITAIKMAVLNI